MNKLTMVMALAALAGVSACSKSTKPAATLPAESKKSPAPAARTAEPAVAETRTETMPAEDSLQLSTIYFAFDSAALSDAARAQLNDNARWLEKNPGKLLVIEGHTDEMGTNEYNLALGLARAKAAYDYLVRLGVDPGRLSTITYGEERPADPAVYERNRRSEFVPRAKGPQN